MIFIKAPYFSMIFTFSELLPGTENHQMSASPLKLGNLRDYSSKIEIKKLSFIYSFWFENLHLGWKNWL